MKPKFIFFLGFFLIPAMLPAADSSWANEPVNSDWLNARNWNLGSIPADNSYIEFGESKGTNIALSAGDYTVDTIHFTAPALNPPYYPTYRFDLNSGARLELTGNGIINDGPPASNATSATKVPEQFFHVHGGASLIFSGDNATIGSVRLLNQSGLIEFRGNSSAGNGTTRTLLYNEAGVNPGQSMIRFTDNAHGGLADIRNYGQGAIIRFEGYSQSGVVEKASVPSGQDHAIQNFGSGSLIVFTGNSVVSSDTRLFNGGVGSVISVIGNATINGNYRTAGNSTVAFNRSRATTLSNGTIVNNGTKTIMYLGGYATANNAILSNNDGGETVIFITDNFKSEGLLSIVTNGGISSRVQLSSETGNVTINGTAYMLSYSTNSSFVIGKNVTINHQGNIETYYGMNGSSTTAPSYFTITDNAKVYANGNKSINLMSSSAVYSYFTINGTAEVYNAIINMTDSDRRVAALANGTAKPYEVKFTIGENALFSTNRSMAYLGGTETFLHITDSANLILENNANLNGTRAKWLSDKNSNITLKGAETRITGNGSFLIVTDNARFTAEKKFVVNGTNASFTAQGNSIVNIIGTLSANGSSAKTNPLISIRENANFTVGELHIATPIFTLEIAQAEGATPITINTINATSAATSPTVRFTGNANQHLLIGPTQLTDISNLSFTEDFENSKFRGSVTLNATGRTLNLNRQNTLSGNITIDNGTVTLDDEHAADTATIVINADGTLSYGSNITTELTLGGLGGNGIFNADIDDIYIGNNGYDSSFNGTLSGTGNITKTGNGVFTLDNSTSSLDLSGYNNSASISVQNGTLALNAVALSFMADGNPLTVHAGAALRIGQGQSSLNELSIQSGGLIDVEVEKNNGVIKNGNLQFGNLVNTSFADIRYRTTQNMSLSDTRIAQGDLIKNFATTTDQTIIDDINLEGGSKDYGKVKSTNTISYNLYGEVVGGSTANLSLEVLTNSLAEYANNPNQAAIAGALDVIISQYPDDLLAQLANNTDDVPGLIDTMNPAGLSSMSRLVYQQTNSEIDVISSRLDMQRHLNSSLRQNRQISDAILRVSSNIQSFQLPASVLTAATSNAGFTLTTDKTLPHQETPWSAYLAGTGSFGKMDGDERSAGYDYHQAGITLGLDKPLAANEGIAGFQISYHHGKSELDKPSEGSVKLNSLRLAGYAGFLTHSGISIQGHAAISYHDYETERATFHYDGSNITTATSEGDTNGYGAAISGELAKIYTLGKSLQWKHGPYALLTYDYLRIDGYGESGATTSLNISKQTPDSLRSTLGWKLWYENTYASGNTLLLNLRLGWAHEYNNPNQSISARFANYDAGFTVRGPNTRRDSLAYELGVQYLLTTGRFLSFQYQGDLNNDQNTHSINAAIGWKW